MKTVGEIINNNVNNVNKYKLNNDINVNPNKRMYMLDKSKFIPRTEESQLAEEISVSLKDDNFACFYSVVKEIGCSEARRLWMKVLNDIKEKEKTKTPVRKKGAYFMWLYRKGMY